MTVVIIVFFFLFSFLKNNQVDKNSTTLPSMSVAYCKLYIAGRGGRGRVMVFWGMGEGPYGRYIVLH